MAEKEYYNSGAAGNYQRKPLRFDKEGRPIFDSVEGQEYVETLRTEDNNLLKALNEETVSGWKGERTRSLERALKASEKAYDVINNKKIENTKLLNSINNNIDELTDSLAWNLNKFEDGVISKEEFEIQKRDMEFKLSMKERERIHLESIREDLNRSLDYIEINKNKYQKTLNKPYRKIFKNLDDWLDKNSPIRKMRKWYRKHSPLRNIKKKFNNYFDTRRMQRLEYKRYRKIEKRLNLKKGTYAKKVRNKFVEGFLSNTKLGRFITDIKKMISSLFDPLIQKFHSVVTNRILFAIHKVKTVASTIGKSAANALASASTTIINGIVAFFTSPVGLTILGIIISVIIIVFGTISAFTSIPIMGVGDHQAQTDEFQQYYEDIYNPSAKFIKDYRVQVPYNYVMAAAYVLGDSSPTYFARDEDVVYDFYEFFLDELKEKYKYWHTEWDWDEIIELEVSKQEYDNYYTDKVEEYYSDGYNWVEVVNKRYWQEVRTETWQNAQWYCDQNWVKEQYGYDNDACLAGTHQEIIKIDHYYLSIKKGKITNQYFTQNENDEKIQIWNDLIRYDMDSLVAEEDKNWEKVYAKANTSGCLSMNTCDDGTGLEPGGKVTKRIYYWTTKNISTILFEGIDGKDAAYQLANSYNPYIIDNCPEDVAAKNGCVSNSFIRKGRVNDPILAEVDTSQFYRLQYDEYGEYDETYANENTRNATMEAIMAFSMFFELYNSEMQANWLNIFDHPLHSDYVRLVSPFGSQRDIVEMRHNGNDYHPHPVRENRSSYSVYSAYPGTVVQVYNSCVDSPDSRSASPASGPNSWNCGPINTMGYNNSGNTIIVEHEIEDDNGVLVKVYTTYCHLTKDSMMVSVGDFVDSSTELAKVGNSGASSGPHLHFGVFTVVDGGVWTNYSSREYIDGNMMLKNPLLEN